MPLPFKVETRVESKRPSRTMVRFWCPIQARIVQSVMRKIELVLVLGWNLVAKPEGDRHRNCDADQSSGFALAEKRSRAVNWSYGRWGTGRPNTCSLRNLRSISICSSSRSTYQLRRRWLQR